MNSFDIVTALDGIDEKYLLETETHKQIKVRNSLKIKSIIAAALILVIVIPFLIYEGRIEAAKAIDRQYKVYLNDTENRKFDGMHTYTVTKEEFSFFLENFEYEKVVTTHGYTIYYKTINGYKTNDAYLVWYGETIKTYEIKIFKEEIERIKNKPLLNEDDFNAPEKYKDHNLQEIYSKSVIYLKKDKEIYPVVTIDASYISYTYHSSYRHIFCYNLLDGSEMDYYDLVN